MNDPPDGDVLSLNADSLTLTAECNHVLYKPCIVININKPHLETQCAQGNALACRFHMCLDNVKVTLFRSYCSSLYTSQLWWNYRVNSIRKLYVAYNNAFRMLFRLPRVIVVQAACLR